MPSADLAKVMPGLGHARAAGLIDFRASSGGRRSLWQRVRSRRLLHYHGHPDYIVTELLGVMLSTATSFYIVARYGVVFHVKRVMSAHPWRLVT